MKYSLTVHHRLLLLGILPKEGDLLTIRQVYDLRRAAGITEDEHAALQFTTEGGLIRWEDDAVPDIELDIGPKALNVILKAIGKLDKAGALTEEHLLLVDLFEYEGA